ncbi:MAG: rhodanese-like domain-containing protein [Acidobacteriota bacterium]
MKVNVSVRKIGMVALSVWTVLFLFMSVCAALQPDVPHISIEELKTMMDKGEEVTIIDAQPADIYAAGHIKGAISIPWKSQIALEDVWNIPNDIPIITYCDCGPGEADSTPGTRLRRNSLTL